jgi:hypothetical protein
MCRSPLDFLIWHRVEMACQNLAFVELSVTDVAMEVGFNNIEYFSQKFSTIMGIFVAGLPKAELGHGGRARGCGRLEDTECRDLEAPWVAWTGI